MTVKYCRRLIEVDLPTKRISAHARREKSIRHGHISTLHIWWARRPLAACRAVICAALWPDPADPLCPQPFRDAAARTIQTFAQKAVPDVKLRNSCSEESLVRWEALTKDPEPLDPRDDAHLNILRFALLDFIADFANWDNSTVPEYLGVGDWRDVLTELPKRIHDWLPRLASEGIVGADAIFACLGPALEIFSRYAKVEKATGEPVELKEYLEHVWAAVAKEALSVIFADADVTGFDPDARLTAMWFWTLSTGETSNGRSSDTYESDGESDEESPGTAATGSGFILEYDAARKIAQGLGAHLEQLTQVVEVKGDKARLLPVSERARLLFGKEDRKAPKRGKKKVQQRSLFDEAGADGAEEGSWGELNATQAGATVLDRLHQSMILFGAGRSEALKRFLIEEGIGRDTRFWRLAQALSALYPSGSEEKRWVDGVLGRKKGLGL